MSTLTKMQVISSMAWNVVVAMICLHKQNLIDVQYVCVAVPEGAYTHDSSEHLVPDQGSVKSEGYGAILLKAKGKTILILSITI